MTTLGAASSANMSARAYDVTKAVEAIPEPSGRPQENFLGAGATSLSLGRYITDAGPSCDRADYEAGL